MRRVLPKILAVITQCDRRLIDAGVDFEWGNLWTANFFLALEVIFGVRYGKNGKEGIKKQTSAASDGTWQVAHTWRAAIVLAEHYIRSYRFTPMRVYIPVLMTPQGIPVLASPYLFAIARDANASANNSGGANLSFSIVLVAANTYVTVGVIQNDTSASTPTCTIGGATATKIGNAVAPSTLHNVTAFGLAVAASGSTTVAVSGTSTNQLEGNALSYSGVLGGLDASITHTGTISGLSLTVSLTTIADNCWIVWHIYAEAGILTASTNASKVTGTANDMDSFDTNSAQTPAGSKSMTVTSNSNNNYSDVTLSLSPVAPAAAATNVVPAAIIMFK